MAIARYVKPALLALNYVLTIDKMQVPGRVAGLIEKRLVTRAHMLFDPLPNFFREPYTSVNCSSGAKLLKQSS